MKAGCGTIGTRLRRRLRMRGTGGTAREMARGRPQRGQWRYRGRAERGHERWGASGPSCGRSTIAGELTGEEEGCGFIEGTSYGCRVIPHVRWPMDRRTRREPDRDRRWEVGGVRGQRPWRDAGWRRWRLPWRVLVDGMDGERGSGEESPTLSLAKEDHRWGEEEGRRLGGGFDGRSTGGGSTVAGDIDEEEGDRTGGGAVDVAGSERGSGGAALGRDLAGEEEGEGSDEAGGR